MACSEVAAFLQTAGALYFEYFLANVLTVWCLLLEKLQIIYHK